MPIRLLCALACACCILLIFHNRSAVADADVPPQIISLLNKANAEHLSENAEWFNLLHYRSTFFGGFESQVDDARFFLAKDGKHNATSELRESILQLFSDKALSDTHPRCRFIARYYWLSEKLGIKNPDSAACVEFHKWLTDINPKSALLVFPAAYLNSPSSMFGHTLLRLDPDDYRKEIPLAAYAINFAAQLVNQDNEFLYAYRGLFGGYPGNFNIVPYHQKIKEYSDLENRDIWEYSLNLSSEEIMRMMRHLWELKSIRFDYFFMSENCSYQLLGLLDVARPSLHLSQKFTWRTMPIDTIKAILNSGMVQQIGYRPSQSKLLLKRFSQIPAHLQQQVRLLTRPDIDLERNLDTELSPAETAQVLELSYDFLRYQASSVRAEHKPQYQKSYQLLKRRSLIPIGNVWPEAEVPKVRSDQFHGSSRTAVAFGRLSRQNYLSLQYRPAYHQELDPDSGADYGAAINFFDFDLRYLMQSKTLELTRLNVLNIESLTPKNGLFSPWSWMVNLENRKTLISDYQRFNMTQLNASFGKTLALDAQDKHSISFLIDNQAFSNSKLEKKLAIGIGPRLYWRSNIGKFALVSDLSWRKSALGTQVERKLAYLGLSKYWNKDSSIRLHWRREFWNDTSNTELELSGHYYF